MQTFSLKLINRLTKYYSINKYEATDLVDNEWDFIEQEYINEECTVENMAKYLISIYMVA